MPLRKVLVIAATATAVLAPILGTLAVSVPAQATVDPGVPGLVTDEMTGQPEVVTSYKDGSYGATVCPPVGSCDSLTVATPAFTGVYKRLPGPGSTYHYVPVYRRSWKACRLYSGGTVFECMSGSIVYAATYAACFNGCTVAELRGGQVCGLDEVTIGLTADLTACRNHLVLTGSSAGYASVAYNTYKICEPFHIPGCYSSTWHVNAYGSGTITGPYSGYGVD